MLGFKRFSYLEEKLIVFNGGKQQGQIVFMAGGAGSGKGFAVDNFLDSRNFKVRDVDEWKKAFLKLADVKKRYSELRGLDLRNPKDVFKLHNFVKDKKVKGKTLNLLLHDLRKETLPNILFDVTAKDLDDFTDVIPNVREVGYEPRNIHIVWVLTNYRVAVKQNAGRSRIVPEDILLQTHEGAAKSMYDIIRGYVPSGMDGAIHVILNDPKNTVYYVHPETGEPLDGKDGRPLVIKDFLSIKVKDEGKPIEPEAEVQQQVFDWIIDNIPKTKKTKDIFPPSDNRAFTKRPS